MRRVTADTQTWLAARDFLFDRSDDFSLQFTRAREAFEAEAIHDLRVSTRRLREGIALFAHCFRKRQFVPLRSELKVFTDMLGAIRNTDEALLFFSPLAEKRDGESAAAIRNIVATLRERRVAEQRRLKRELKKLEPGALLDRIDDICSNPRIFNPNARGLLQPVGEYLLGAVAVREQAMLEILPGALVEENIVSQHRLRIAVKRFRYRMEFLAPFAAGDYKGIYRKVKEYQDLLGHLHDLHVFSELAGELVPGEPERGLVQDIIHGRRRVLFGDFLLLQEADPLARLGDRVRGLL